MSPSALFSSAYLPPIQYFSLLKKSDHVFVEHFEHFIKQTYRNRCHIYGANGILKLSIPIIHSGERTPMKDTRISNSYNWQKIHWRSIESAYRRSPYFEFYESDFMPFYLEKKFEYLIDINLSLLQLILESLKIKTIVTPTTAYNKNINGLTDLRNKISPKKTSELSDNPELKPYMQVFENKHGFIPGLSIIDLLFNEGPNTLAIL